MDWNDWKAAGRQLMAHWHRSGVSRIPRPNAETAAQAKSWMDENASALVEDLPSASPISAVPAPSPDRSKTSMTTSDLSPASKPADRSESISQTRPTAAPASISSPIVPAHPQAKTLPNLASGESVHWMTSSKSNEERTAEFVRLNEQVIACRKCSDIVCRRQRTVFGVGPIDAKLVMFGEAPGADEDRLGEPFVGAAGQLMDKILVASGLHRSQVYIMNALRCRPPNNRTPIDEEIENCRPFFEAQLETIQPDYIICWGAVAVRAVLKSTESVGRLRGRFHSYRGAKVLVTYHPAYLLRNADAKRLTWEDMQILMRELGIPIPNRKG